MSHLDLEAAPGTRPTAQVDVRGPRFAAWLTSVVLALVLIVSALSIPAAAVLLAVQAFVFGLGAILGPGRSPYGRIFRAVIAPRIGPATEVEPVAPLRFAQLVGLAFAVLGVIGFAAGSSVAGAIFTGFALFAAFLNAAFGICLGCKIHPLIARLRAASARPTTT